MSRKSVRPSVALMLALALLVGATRLHGAQTLSPYSDFRAMSLSDMDSLRIKLTYGGSQDHILQSLIIAKAGTSPRGDLFRLFRRPGFEYSNDCCAGFSTAARQELKSIIDNVGTLPAVIDGNVDTNGYVSFSLLSTAGGRPRVFEAIVNDTTGRDLFSQMLLALADNPRATWDLRAFGCDVDMLPKNVPMNAEGHVAVSFSGLRPVHSAKYRFMGWVTVTNTSETRIPAPVTLVVMRRGNADLLDADGLTCTIEPTGVPFVDLGLPSGLGVGESITRALSFTDPSLMKFDLQFRVFAGVGTR